MDYSPENRDVFVRYATTPKEIIQAQKLRYDVFYRECKANPSEEIARQQRDFDSFDTIAKHLIVVDPKLPESKQIIGTYRLIDHESANEIGQFYTDDEYDLSSLRRSNLRLLELGRSCVRKEYRTRPVLQLLWQGIADYIFENDIDLTFGCASLHGTDITSVQEELSYLYHYHRAPSSFCTRALEARYVSMNIVPKEALNVKEIFHRLPPLIKGYLRVGALIGDGAVIDHDFNTIDVCVLMATNAIPGKYRHHFDKRFTLENPQEKTIA